MKTVKEYLEDLEKSRYRKTYEKFYSARNLSSKEKKLYRKARVGYPKKLDQVCGGVWSNTIHERAEWTCELCGKRSSEAHHIIPKSQCAGMKFDLKNGIALCAKHHGSRYSGGVHSKDSGEYWYKFNLLFPKRYEKLYKKKVKILKGKTVTYSIDDLITILDNLVYEYGRATGISY